MNNTIKDATTLTGSSEHDATTEGTLSRGTAPDSPPPTPIASTDSDSENDSPQITFEEEHPYTVEDADLNHDHESEPDAEALGAKLFKASRRAIDIRNAWQDLEWVLRWCSARVDKADPCIDKLDAENLALHSYKIRKWLEKNKSTIPGLDEIDPLGEALSASALLTVSLSGILPPSSANRAMILLMSNIALDICLREDVSPLWRWRADIISSVIHFEPETASEMIASAAEGLDWSE